MAIDPWRHVHVDHADIDDADVEDASGADLDHPIDTELIADLIAGTVEVVLEVGGRLHPSLRVVVRGGELSVEADVPEGEPIIELPSAAFLPIARVTWDDGDVLRFHDDDDVLSDAGFALLTMQVALHNACGKLPRLIATHPQLAADLTPEVVSAVRAVKPGFRSEERSPVSLFWSNRVLRIPRAAGGEPEPMALPIVDCLDHRSGGATGTWTGEGFHVTAAHAGAAPACFLDYGHDRDPLDLALDYGFADPHAGPTPGMADDRAAIVALRDLASASTGPAARTIAAASRRQLALLDAGP